MSDREDETSKTKSSQHVRNANVDRRRRRLIELIVAGQHECLASPWIMRSAHAAGRAVKIGMVSPANEPIAAFGEADRFVLAGVRKALPRA